MTNSLSEQVAGLERQITEVWDIAEAWKCNSERHWKRVEELEAERDDLQRQVQEARDECDALRAGQGRWPITGSTAAPRGDCSAPVKDVDTSAPSLKENGENFTHPSRLSVHALNVAPVGSVVQNAGGSGWTKRELGMWTGPLGLQTWSSTELLAIADFDATLRLPEDDS